MTNITKYERFVAETLLLLLLLALPFERVLTFDVAGFTVKPPYLAGILLICYFFYSVISKKVKIKIESYDYAAIAFIVFSYTTFFWSIDRAKTVIISSMFLFVYLIFLSVRSFVYCHSEQSEESQRSFSSHSQDDKGPTANYEKRQKNKIDLYITIFIWLGVGCSIFALFQFFGDSAGLPQHVTGLSDLYTKSVFGFPRVQSTFFEPGFFANFLLIAIFANMARLTSGRRLYYVSFLIIFTAFILTLSRGGFFAFAIAYAITAILIIFKAKDKAVLVYRSLGLMLVSVFLALSCVWLVSGSQGVNRFSDQARNAEDLVAGMSQENVQNFTRNTTIKIAIENWKDNIFGIGTGAFGSLPEFNKTREMGNQRQTVNSLYPEILVEGGIQSLIAFLAFIGLLIFIVLRLFWRTGDTETLLFAASVGAIFLQYLSFSTLYLIYVWVFLGLVPASTESSDGKS